MTATFFPNTSPLSVLEKEFDSTFTQLLHVTNVWLTEPQDAVKGVAARSDFKGKFNTILKLFLATLSKVSSSIVNAFQK